MARLLLTQMSNKLSLRSIPAWGEDLSAFLKVCRKEGDSELVQQVEEKLLAGYLMGIRTLLTTDHVANKVAAESYPATSAAPGLIDRFWHLAKPGSEDIFQKAVEIILEELDAARLKEPSLYLVNVQTGRAVLPFNKDTVFQPPDYIGEDGLVHKARPIVHPALTSAMALAQQEAARREIVLKKSKDPKFKSAVEHLLDPEGMITSAKERLQAVGVVIDDIPSDSEPQEVEFGREAIDGINQAPNYQFHRKSTFSAILAQKILRLCGPGGHCHIGPIRERKGSKQRWYAVSVTVRAAPLSLPASK